MLWIEYFITFLFIRTDIRKIAAFILPPKLNPLSNSIIILLNDKLANLLFKQAHLNSLMNRQFIVGIKYILASWEIQAHYIWHAWFLFSNFKCNLWGFLFNGWTAVYSKVFMMRGLSLSVHNILSTFIYVPRMCAYLSSSDDLNKDSQLNQQMLICFVWTVLALSSVSKNLLWKWSRN